VSEREEAELMAGCLRRLEVRHGHFTMELPFGQVVTLVAQVQLALRHPGNAGPAAADARRMVEDVIASLGAEEPALAGLLRRGFDPAHDVAKEQ
jgi:hypothetical protein